MSICIESAWSCAVFAEVINQCEHGQCIFYFLFINVIFSEVNALRFALFDFFCLASLFCFTPYSDLSSLELTRLTLFLGLLLESTHFYVFLEGLFCFIKPF